MHEEINLINFFKPNFTNTTQILLVEAAENATFKVALFETFGLHCELVSGCTFQRVEGDVVSVERSWHLHPRGQRRDSDLSSAVLFLDRT